jgi:predicted ribosomally synthesized peptide with SipW-like signal peptide
MTARHSTRRLKLTLAALIAVGGVSCITVSGTYAVFTSQETHVSNKITSGTLILSETWYAVGSTTGTTCTSNGTGSSGNLNATCTALMSSSTLQYPGFTQTEEVKISDTGTLDGLTLSLYMPSCSSTTSPSSTGHQGGGLACQTITEGSSADGLQLMVQETQSDWKTPIACWFPVSASGYCSAASGYSTSAPNSFGNFAQHLTSTSHVLSLGSGPTAGASRYFLVTVALPTYASNTLQGEEASFGLTWHLAD